MGLKPLFQNKGFKFVLLLGIVSACWYLGRMFKLDVPAYQSYLSKFPVALSGLIFVLLYVGTTTFLWFGPKDILRISSAILFGAATSALFVWAGEMINAFVMFSLSRVLGREYVQQKFRLKQQDLDKIKDDTSWIGIVAVRINPLIPFRFMDLGYGLTRVSFQKYFAAILAISFLRILWLQFILADIGVNLFKDTSAIMDYFLENPLVLQYSALYFLAVIVVTVIAFVTRAIKKRNKEKNAKSQ